MHSDGKGCVTHHMDKDTILSYFKCYLLAMDIGFQHTKHVLIEIHMQMLQGLKLYW